MEEEPSSKLQSYTSSNMENAELLTMMPLPEMINPKLPHFGGNHSHLQLTPYENNQCTEPQLQIHFPRIPQTQQGLSFSPESQELLARLEDPYFFDVFGPVDAPPELSNEAQLPVEQTFLKPETSCSNGVKDENDKSVNPDAFFDDFPTDMFDHIEPLPSPSGW